MIAFIFGDTKLSQVHRAAVRAHLKRLPMLSGIVHMNKPGAARIAHSEALGTTSTTVAGRPDDESLERFVRRLQDSFGVSFWLALHQQPALTRGGAAPLLAMLKTFRVPGRIVLLGEDGHTLRSEDFNP